MYLWLKAAHVVFVVAWMAGLLIYPRYKIHQLSSAAGEPLFETMMDASARLKRIILSPSMMIVWILGLGMIAYDYWRGGALITSGWLHLKLALVAVLTGVHIYFTRIGRQIDSGKAPISAKRLRMMNEVPFILMVAIVILVIIKPVLW